MASAPTVAPALKPAGLSRAPARRSGEAVVGPRIGFDAASVVGPRTGIGHATAELLTALAEIWPENWPVARVWVNSRRHALPEHDPWMSARVYDVKRTTLPGRLILRGWQYLGWPPAEIWTGPIDLLHSPASYIPAVRAARRVVTVHDIYFKHAPTLVDTYGGKYFYQTFERGLPEVDQIIAVSEFTRAELLKHYRVSPEKVSVVPHAVNLNRFREEPAPDDNEHLRQLGIEKPYLLCVATIEPRKNLVTLLEAYARARRIMEAGGQKLPRLVITGQPAWGIKPFEARLREAKLQDLVTPTGYVPDAALPALYRQALGFVFPSLYEGFGLPVLEAMACGCPTLISRAGSLPEIAGDAAHYFNPRESGSIARELVTFLADPMHRSALRDAGLRRARQFTWAATARGTLNVYRRVLGLTECA
ncbi:MAG TPA: glycosyltransferase family 1 protein [Candidatus Sumerlaeota bacterium]|nr:MAG: Capsular glucan synthase [candidate division BRC1 bacterium ADurb.BinA292]HOE95299.1 glycosyltransferase family 1 protein [Candidatus Sumerlaeota bacterium]HOR27866.1 glycosyltransferase family 1 protein [Candidatus Sumerlaeota bacterium]HPK00917.1 glycosyltransferase family 1 protein [Candidatus Sumerlaeota bacterium]